MANTWVNREDSFLSLKFSVSDSGGSRAALVTGMGSAEMKRERRAAAGVEWSDIARRGRLGRGLLEEPKQKSIA